MLEQEGDEEDTSPADENVEEERYRKTLAETTKQRRGNVKHIPGSPEKKQRTEDVGAGPTHDMKASTPMVQVMPCSCHPTEAIESGDFHDVFATYRAR